jgi:hypothetical protein
MPRALLALAGAVVVCLVPASTGAKEGVRARLDRPVPAHAPAGTLLRVGWTLRSGSRPFGASGIYVELRSASSGRLVRAIGKHRGRAGHYVARIRAPRGGVDRVRIGLQGWRMYPGGRTERADVFFPIDGRTRA